MPFKDKEKQLAYQREWIAKRRNAFFSDKACVVCGSVIDLELDHIDPSTKVSHRIWSWSEKKRQSELAKCQVLCNTHHLEKSVKALQREIVHGTHERGYLRGCRCSECKRGHSAYNALWKKRRSVGESGRP